MGLDHINGIEGFWSYAKHWLYQYRGVPRKFFHLYLGEICNRFNHRNVDQKPLLDKLLRSINFQEINSILVRESQALPTLIVEAEHLLSPE